MTVAVDVAASGGSNRPAEGKASSWHDHEPPAKKGKKALTKY